MLMVDEWFMLIRKVMDSKVACWRIGSRMTERDVYSVVGIWYALLVTKTFFLAHLNISEIKTVWNCCVVCLRHAIRMKH